MPVGGGSFQEYYDGGNFTNWAEIAGPVFKGVEGHTGDVQPTAMTDCTFFGNCSLGGYGGCHNETTNHCVPKNGCTTGSSVAGLALATQTFKGGRGQEVAKEWIPPWLAIPTLLYAHLYSQLLLTTRLPALTVAI